LPEQFENAALILQLGLLTVHSDLSEKWSFSKLLFKADQFENTGVEF